MLRRCLAAFLLLAASVALLDGLAGPTASALTADTITVDYAGSPQSNPGQLWIYAFATTDITSMTAELIPATGSPIAVDNLQLVSGTALSGEWQVPALLSLPAYGAYTISVSATDSGGGSLSNYDAGTLLYFVRPEPTISASPSTLDYDHRTVTFSGTVTGLNPDGTSAPFANATVSIYGNFTPGGGVVATATTASDGTYQVVVNNMLPGPYQVQVPASDINFQAVATFWVNSVADPAQLTAQLSATQVDYQQPVTITGRLTYEPAGASTYQPLANYPIGIYWTSGAGPIKTAVTASDGTYTATVTMTHDGAFQVGTELVTGTVDPLFPSAFVSTQSVTVAFPVQVSKIAASVDAFGNLTVKGCLYSPARYPWAPLTIQYASQQSGPWRTFATIENKKRLKFNTCGPSLHYSFFTDTLAAPAPTAYYRVIWAGDNQYQPAVSKSVLAGRYLTRIMSLHVSATQLAQNAKLTVTGRLQQYTAGQWRSYGSRQILIVLRPKGRTKWYWIAKPYTSSTGHFTATFKDPVSATWSAVYLGDKTHYATSARLVFVKVTSGVRTPYRVLVPSGGLQQLSRRIGWDLRHLPASVIG